MPSTESPSTKMLPVTQHLRWVYRTKQTKPRAWHRCYVTLVLLCHSLLFSKPC
jgi:hypothetical protein